MVPVLLIPLLYFLTLGTILLAPVLNSGPLLGLLFSTTTSLIGDFFANFGDSNSPLTTTPAPAVVTTSNSLLRRFVNPAALSNTTCLPRRFDDASGIFDPTVICELGGVSLHASMDKSFAHHSLDMPLFHNLQSIVADINAFAFLVVFVVGIVYCIHTVRRCVIASRPRDTTNAARKNLENAVSRYVLSYEAGAVVLGGYPSVLETIGQAISAHSQAIAELDSRAEVAYERAVSHETKMIGVTDDNKAMEVKLELLQDRIVEHAWWTSTLEDEATEKYVALLEELEESEARLERAEEAYVQQGAALMTVEIDLATTLTARDTYVRQGDALLAQAHSMEKVDEAEEKLHIDEIAIIQSSIVDTESTIKQTSQRVAAVTVEANEVQEALNHAINAAHYTEQMLHGDICAATAAVTLSGIEHAAERAQYAAMLESHNKLEATHQLAIRQGQDLEAEVAQLDLKAADLLSETTREKDAYDEAVLRLTQDNNALVAAETAALTEMARIKATVALVEKGTALSLGALTDRETSAREEHASATRDFQRSIDLNNTRIIELQTSHKLLKEEITTKQAEYDTRHRVFNRESTRHGERFDLIMSSMREAKLDKQQYESLHLDANRRQKQAEKKAAEAEKKAAEAMQQSVDMEKEMAISGCAFDTQLEDVSEQNDRIASSNKDAADVIRRLRDDNTMFEEVLAKLEKTSEDRERPLLFRLRRAEEDLAVYSLTEEDRIAQLDASLHTLQIEESRIAALQVEYGNALSEVHTEVERVVELQQDVADATWAAEEQAKVLERLVLTPSCGHFDTLPFSNPSSAYTSPALSTPELEDVDCDLLFDASFEEALSGDIVDSATVCGLKDVGSGLTEHGVGLGLVL